jgi:hypothetical protein
MLVHWQLSASGFYRWGSVRIVHAQIVIEMSS